MRRVLSLFCFVLYVFCIILPIQAQVSAEAIQNLIRDFKKDQRGPFQAIRWFCPDGSVIPANQRCSQPGGIQHALHKDIVQRIANERHIFLGQILAGTKFEDFFDAQYLNSRILQYHLERFLIANDEGWILRQAQYYRGAFQVEDEESWGLSFLHWLMSNDQALNSQFFLVRQSTKIIPHSSNDDRLGKVRALSKSISDSMSSFIDLRVKLHGQPEASDLHRVQFFYRRHQQTLKPKVKQMMEGLISEMEILYAPANYESLKSYLARLPKQSGVTGDLQAFISGYVGSETKNLPNQCKGLADIMLNIREDILDSKSPLTRLAMIDLSLELESILFRIAGSWHPASIEELMTKHHTLAKAAAGCGFLEMWEWGQIQASLNPAFLASKKLTIKTLLEKLNYSGRVLEWCAGMVTSTYGSVIRTYSKFEPLANAFVDDQIRGSILLPMGENAWQLAEAGEKYIKLSNNVMGIRNQNQIRGLNPGYAMGVLEVVTGNPEDIVFSPAKIYLLTRAPADLKPVAGIATVTEGNLVSHVQLLARNLGIPNAVLSAQNLADLALFAGRTVFYAVSRQGRVILKPNSEMSVTEKALFASGKTKEERIAVPVDRIDLTKKDFIKMSQIRATDSGTFCGPKAANLAELKHNFPDKVIDGIVIPFGVFKAHLAQSMPGKGMTYWQFIQQTFIEANNAKAVGKPESEIEIRLLARLEELREAIKRITFLPGFHERLQINFQETFGRRIGNLPVFLRSDTNMEDLKDFSGAGLNLTVFNVVDEVKIYQGIRDVWASPYTERSFRWRQKFLTNPENVYPSILILPTINVDKSGVMITTGTFNSDTRDITIAFNRGAGGAVEGQASESYLLKHDSNNLLLSPARELEYTILSSTGGTSKGHTHLNSPILDRGDLAQLRAVATEIKSKLSQAVTRPIKEPYDVELGFMNGKVWLFQVRPYVENKKAQMSQYLRTLDPPLPENLLVNLAQKLN